MLKVGGHPGRSGRKKGVVFMEHFFRLHLLRQLHHAAVRAKCHLKFKEILIRKLSRAKKAIRNRHPAEGHEWFNQSITYQAFIHDFLTISLQKSN